MSYAAISTFSVGFLLTVFVAVTLLSDRLRRLSLFPVWIATLLVIANWAWTHEWGVGLSTALMGNILATQVAFGLLLIFFNETIRLSIFLGPYLLLAFFLVVWSSFNVSEMPLNNSASAWLLFHIASSILAYGLVTIGAIAGLATIVRDRALKRRIRSRYLEQLPSVLSTARIELVGLWSAEAVLGLGIVFGVAAEFMSTGQYFELSHKSLFSLLAFALIGVLLLLHLRSGLRGRFAARLALAAYLLVSLGYPGVKFVNDILVR